MIGGISLAALAVALFALYGRSLAGFWRATYVASAMLALYLNVFVAIVPKGVEDTRQINFLDQILLLVTGNCVGCGYLMVAIRGCKRYAFKLSDNPCSREQRPTGRHILGPFRSAQQEERRMSTISVVQMSRHDGLA